MKLVQDHDPMARDEQAALWCMRLADGSLPAEERAELGLWLEDADNAHAFHEQADLWGLIDDAAASPELIRMRGDALDDYRAANAGRWTTDGPARRTRWQLTKMAIAAAIVMAVGAGLFTFLPDRPWDRSTEAPRLALAGQMTEYRTGRAERSVAMLEDGSRLALDADSAVQVRITDSRREVMVLQGRAGFTVAKNHRPFAVTAGDKTVVATGTKFSVELINRSTNVVLYEGSVIILRGRLDGGKQIAAMKPGSALTLPAFGASDRAPPQVDAARTPNWESGQLEFVDERLPAVVARFNRYAARPLVIAPGVSDDLRITGVFEATDTASFAQGVATLHGLTVERQADRTVLTAGNGTAH